MNIFIITLVAVELVLAIAIYFGHRERKDRTERAHAIDRAISIRKTRFCMQEQGNERALADLEELAQLIKSYQITEKELGCKYARLCVEAYRSFVLYLRWYKRQVIETGWEQTIDVADCELCLAVPQLAGETHLGYAAATLKLRHLEKRRRIFGDMARALIVKATVFTSFLPKRRIPFRDRMGSGRRQADDYLKNPAFQATFAKSEANLRLLTARYAYFGKKY